MVDIVKDICIKVENKQFVGIIDPSRGGKSTLLKKIYKLIKPQKRSVFLGNKDTIRLSVRMVSKDMSGCKNI